MQVVRKKNNSFASENRLKTKKDFKRVFNKSTKTEMSCFIFYSRRSKLENPRLGVSVAKRNFKRAVHRNFIKRIVKESFRTNKSQLRSIDVVAIAKRANHKKIFMDRNKKALLSDLEKYWRLNKKGS